MESTVERRVTFGEIVRAYRELMKLRIVTLLVFTTVTAMVVAQKGIPPLSILIPTLIGGIFAAGGASAMNQYLDRDMDALMTRTSRRPKTGPIRLFSPESSLSQADNAPDHRATLIASALRIAPAHHHQLRNATVVLGRVDKVMACAGAG